MFTLIGCSDVVVTKVFPSPSIVTPLQFFQVGFYSVHTEIGLLNYVIIAAISSWICSALGSAAEKIFRPCAHY